MNITETMYKNVPAIRLENDRYSLTVLPGEGAKIVSFQTKNGQEFLWQNPNPTYGHIGLSDSYVDGECSSFDDMFPTIDPITLSVGSRANVEYPDHGEVCRLAFSYEIMQNSVCMETHSERLQYTYRKTISENENGDLSVHYEIENHAPDAFRALWAGHCMIQVCDGGEILVPFADDATVEMMFDEAKAFGCRGEIRQLTSEMLRSSMSPEKRNSFKYYFQAPTSVGEIGYRYADGTIFWMRYDAAALPYVGMWVNNGFFHNSHCVGLEPCNLGYDTVENAAERGQHFSIAPHQNWAFDLTFSVEETK